MDDKLILKFYMKEPEDDWYTGQEYEAMMHIDDNDEEFEPRLEYLLKAFKRFLNMVGFSDVNLSRLQYLEDEEWKHVLTEYNEWDGVKEEIYQWRTNPDHEFI